MFKSVLAQKVEGAVAEVTDPGAAIPTELILQIVQLILNLVTGGNNPCDLFAVEKSAEDETDDTVLVHAYQLLKQSDYDGNAAKLAAKIRDTMQKLMGRFADKGACDTEPQCVLVAELERAFGLERYSLERW